MVAPRGRGFRWDLAGLVVGAFGALGMLSFIAVMAGWLDPGRKLPPNLDFAAFWSAAHLAAQHAAAPGVLDGTGGAAYNNVLMEAFERAHTQMPPTGLLPFYYPPTFLLLCLPLAFLPYLPALALFLLTQAALFWPLVHRVLVRAGGGRLGWLPVLAMPGFLMTMFSGQTGGLSVCCLAGATLLLDQRPLLGGACLGALAYKPQLAILAPLALLAARRWQAIVGAAGTAIALAGASVVVLGTSAWAGFVANAPLARSDIQEVPVRTFAQSVFAALRHAGFGLAASYTGQALAAAAALVVLAVVCWRQKAAGIQMAALAVAALMATPYLNDYDLVLLAVPMAWLAGQAVRYGFLYGEKALLVVAYLAPFLARVTEINLGLMLSPPILAALLVCISRRALLRAA
jgi:hypothetical protein